MTTRDVKELLAQSPAERDLLNLFAKRTAALQRATNAAAIKASTATWEATALQVLRLRGETLLAEVAELREVVGVLLTERGAVGLSTAAAEPANIEGMCAQVELLVSGLHKELVQAQSDLTAASKAEAHYRDLSGQLGNKMLTLFNESIQLEVERDEHAEALLILTGYLEMQGDLIDRLYAAIEGPQSAPLAGDEERLVAAIEVAVDKAAARDLEHARLTAEVAGWYERWRELRRQAQPEAEKLTNEVARLEARIRQLEHTNASLRAQNERAQEVLEEERRAHRVLTSRLDAMRMRAEAAERAEFERLTGQKADEAASLAQLWRGVLDEYVQLRATATQHPNQATPQ